MTVAFAQRTDGLRLEGAYQVLARAQELEAQGRQIVHLEIGEPDFPTPENIGRAAARAIAEGKTHYNPSAGIRELRAAIAADASRRRGLTILPEQVVVSPGAKPNLFFPALALVNPGEEVVYPDPGFPTYEAMIRVTGGVGRPVPLLESNGFSIDRDVLAQLVNARTRLIILNSPGNPTGGVIPQGDLEFIAELAQRHDCWVLSDEIYSRIVFGERAVPTIAALPGMRERTIILDGFSKTYAMTGWRLGYGIMPERLAERVSLLLNHGVGCTAHFTQIAGIEALTGPQDSVDRMVAEFQRRRERIVDGLSRLRGVRCRKPEGAFYVFPNIEGTGLTSEEFAARMLEGGVALLPGTAFGDHGRGYVRLAFTNSLEAIDRALESMDTVLSSL
ncbi:MAG: pyridoxal phosphate-dependent aminotransferase [Chloroflexi bacterium]|nr:pyridoxal phosphate-dependent aminotransferase [Chloroflexota bacterium]